MLRTFATAKTLCGLSDWSLSNLKLQKLLYLAHMIYMGENDGARLIDGRFEAWELGPVEPGIYQRAKAFGSKPVNNVFPGRPFADESAEAETIAYVWQELGHLPATKLVNITHSEDGAWAQNFKKGVRGIEIPNEDILDEYRKRFEE